MRANRRTDESVYQFNLQKNTPTPLVFREGVPGVQVLGMGVGGGNVRLYVKIQLPALD